MKRIRVGVVGLGSIAKIHLSRIRRIPELKLVAVADIIDKKVRQVSDLYDVQGYTDYRKLCENRNIDAVFILTPPSTHASIAEIAFENEKHIFCEKPLARNVKEAKSIVSKANKADLTLMIGYMMRFSSNIRIAKKLIKYLGNEITAQTAFVLSLHKEKSTFQYNKEDGGGALLEMGIHHINLLRWFFGEAHPLEVKMKMNGDVDIWTNFSLKFNNGIISNTEISWISDIQRNILSVNGNKGYIETKFRGVAKDNFVKFKIDNILRNAGDLSITVFENRDVYLKEIEHFVKAILTGKEPITSGDEALKDMELIENIYKRAIEL